jgi:signal transduction histidine kinase
MKKVRISIMPKYSVKNLSTSFQTQGRLLQELGERLVAKPEVALLELIKNAYDADATVCHVANTEGKIEIIDDGQGMTEEEFLNNWMHIATPDKQRTRQSRKYHRRVTGSKGIGRFAVRFLGRKLILQTVAEDKSSPTMRTLLSSTFDWAKIDESSQLHTVKIPYTIRAAGSGEKTGTKLIIETTNNTEGIQLTKKERTELLAIVDPYLGLDRGDFHRVAESDKDPGFKAILPGQDEAEESDLVSRILENAYAKLTIEYKDGKVRYRIKTKSGKYLLRKTITYPSNIKNGFFADIRYCPRRAGVFRGTGVDGRQAYTWLKEKGGVGIVDHGFRIRPYGFEDNDWLNLGLDSGHNRRNWRIDFMKNLYPMPEAASSQPKLNPMLYLPSFHQLLGAVFVESTTPSSSKKQTQDLTPSMDREGFVENTAFRDMYTLIRGGMELLAFADHREQRRIEDEKREEAVEELRADLRDATKYLKNVPGLSPKDRDAVVAQFSVLSKQLEDVEDYRQALDHKLDLMSLLGVMAGFVTHEMQRFLNGIDRLIERLEILAKKDKETFNLLKDVQDARDSMVGQLDYSEAFIDSVNLSESKNEPINAKASVVLAKSQFTDFITNRNIDVDIAIEEDILTPPLPRALYNGVVLNLLTNALKASVGGPEASLTPRVKVMAWNEGKQHVLEIADTGVGIPPNLRKRIWDPLFTTTSRQDYNPLGSGMGLGLTLVKRIVTEAKGKIDLHDPPPGFHTCFRVAFPR